MGMFDVLSGVPMTHDIQVKLWWSDMRTIPSEGSEVFAMEWSDKEYQSYLVQLRPNKEYSEMLPAYLWVSELDTRGVIPEDEVNETDLGEHPVFDKWGHYLGTFETVKGKALQPFPGEVDTPGIKAGTVTITVPKTLDDYTGEETPRVAPTTPDKDLHTLREPGASNFHCVRFPLRRGAEDVCLRIPEDLTYQERTRLVYLVQALPTTEDK